MSGKIRSYTDYNGFTVHYDYSAAYDQPTEINVIDPLGDTIYDVNYVYDMAGRLLDVCEPLMSGDNLIAGFDYDKNGNREQLNCYHEGTRNGTKTSIDYSYNLDNMLTEFVMSNGPAFTLSNVIVDGLGRLISADETVTNVTEQTIDHSYTFGYDMLSRLTYAYTSNVAPTSAREYYYDYDRAGNMTHYTFNNYNPDNPIDYYYTYTGDLRAGSGNKTASFDENGRQTSLFEVDEGDYPIEYDWEGRISWNRATSQEFGMEAKYTPGGVRALKKRNWGEDSYTHKYIVDVSGEVPNILLVIDANNANQIIKTYIHANGQVLAQHDGNYTAPIYFYLHDRLGSVRQIIDNTGDVKGCYYYNPWGDTTGNETYSQIDNWYRWAGYYAEDEMDGYYCNARNYYQGRFLTRDPAKGKYKEPMTLHRYLYCNNDPVNHTDPSGEMSAVAIAAPATAGYETYALAVTFVAYGVAHNNDFAMDLGFAISQCITSVMTSVRTGLDYWDALVNAVKQKDRDDFGRLKHIGEEYGKTLKEVRDAVHRAKQRGQYKGKPKLTDDEIRDILEGGD